MKVNKNIKSFSLLKLLSFNLSKNSYSSKCKKMFFANLTILQNLRMSAQFIYADVHLHPCHLKNEHSSCIHLLTKKFLMSFPFNDMEEKFSNKMFSFCRLLVLRMF